MLYKYIWLDRYTVYRHVFDLNKCSIEEGARAHKVAEFVTEEEAKNYCEYRNYMFKKYGSDAIELITDYKDQNEQLAINAGWKPQINGNWLFQAESGRTLEMPLDAVIRAFDHPILKEKAAEKEANNAN